ncbi:hypothetical protein Godav_018329 [Gossypium davidsonii]|uniref:HMA domain-containing protein n=2 Tax=Gossypium TaxID=3633 RepID=A0A7J8QW41_GOSDV|nr:hypothetical protein [Gossypium davidsonii]MBA0640742.1 hypothetical protein [Gossypium klotzschianum]
MNILYASQVTTSICLSMDEAVSSSCSSAVQLGGRAIDRHNPIIRDAKRFNTNPSPYNQLRTNGNGSSGKSKSKDHKKKSWTKKSSLKLPTDTEDSNGSKGIDFVTPPGSSRYLLGNSGFLDEISDYDPAWVLVPFQENQIKVVKRDQSVVSEPSFSDKPSKDQVVVLRVSLHCKGCEGKVRKHISRMEGVRSYSIDFAAKKVTIVGNVTPLGVLASVSKVKSAQFWTPATPALASTSLSANK